MRLDSTRHLLPRLVVLGLLCAACDDECNPPPILVHALGIRVVDATTGEEICDATVTLETDGEEQTAPQGCRYTGGVRPGKYRVTVVREGYRDHVVSDVEVTGECSVPQTRQLEVELEPELA